MKRKFGCYGRSIQVMMFTLFSFITIHDSSAQSNTELANVKSSTEFKALRLQLNEGFDSPKGLKDYISLDSATWHNIKVKNVLLKDNEVTMQVLAKQQGGTKKILDVLQKQYNDEVKMEVDWIKRAYTVNTTELNIVLRMEVSKDEEIEDKTPSELTITYRPFYDAPYPNIAKTAVKNPSGIFYRLALDYFGSNIEVFVNGISIFNGLARARYMNDDVIALNPFILEKGKVAVKVLITPGLDEEGNPYPTIQKRSHVTAVLQKGIFKKGDFQELSSQKICDYQEYVTDTIHEDGHTRYSSYPGTYKYGGKQLVDETSFVAEVNYQNKGWKDGNDLRNDKQLKEKVIALYQHLADVMRNKDGKALSDMFLQMGQEQAASDYGQKPGTFSDNWELWMMAMENTNVIKVETDFDIEISDDGKLIYASPNKQTDMLRAIGKETATGFTHYMYEDKTTNQLKFIR